jgi:hypothetical protein
VSLPVLTWVLDNSEERLGNRLVLLALAEYAHDDGSKAYPSNETLQKRTRLSERGVRDSLRSLEANGSIRFDRALSNGTRVYSVLGPFNPAESAPAESAPAESAPAENSHAGGQETTTRGAKSAPDPLGSKNRSKYTSPSPGKMQKLDGRAPLTVDGKPVTREEESFAVEVLDVFNDVASAHSDREFQFASKEAVKKIILRRREHPELDVAGHRAIIEGQFDAPWWNGDPTPSVIYGNGEVFDRALNGVRGGRRDNGGSVFDDYV